MRKDTTAFTKNGAQAPWKDRFFVHPDQEQDYRVDLTGRDANVGNNALTRETSDEHTK